MTLVRLVSLVGVSLLVLVANVAMSFLYMVVYSYLINPGHPEAYYKDHIKVAAPYCSLVAGVPLIFMAGFWVAGWAAGGGEGGGGGGGGQLGVKAALVVWLAYVVIDLAVILAAGMNPKIAVVCTASFITKLAAAYAGGLVAGRYAA